LCQNTETTITDSSVRLTCYEKDLRAKIVDLSVDAATTLALLLILRSWNWTPKGLKSRVVSTYATVTDIGDVAGNGRPTIIRLVAIGQSSAVTCMRCIAISTQRWSNLSHTMTNSSRAFCHRTSPCTPG